MGFSPRLEIEKLPRGLAGDDHFFRGALAHTFRFAIAPDFRRENRLMTFVDPIVAAPDVVSEEPPEEMTIAFAGARTHGENDYKPELGKRTLIRALLQATAIKV